MLLTLHASPSTCQHRFICSISLNIPNFTLPFFPLVLIPPVPTHDQALAKMFEDKAEEEQLKASEAHAEKTSSLEEAAAAAARASQAEQAVAEAKAQQDHHEEQARAAAEAVAAAQKQQKEHEDAVKSAQELLKELQEKLEAAEADRKTHEAAAAEAEAALAEARRQAEAEEAALQKAKEEEGARLQAQKELEARFAAEEAEAKRLQEEEENSAISRAERAIRSEGWVPGAFPLRGAAKYAGSIACSCMKHCTCEDDECVCKDANQLPVGPGSFTPTVTLVGESRRSRSQDPEGQCGCVCNVVPGETPAEIKSRWFLEVAFNQIVHPQSQSAGRRLLSELLAGSRQLQKPKLNLKADPATGWCETGFHQLHGDVPGWGKIGTMGGGQDVKDCSECANLCQSIDACLSYQCSFEEMRCKLNVVSEPTPGADQYRDWFFCKKDSASSSVATNVAPGAPPPSSDPPPRDAKLCSLKRSGYCKSYLNNRCSDWRDSAHLWRQSKQISKMEDCMMLDCEQSLQHGGEANPGCRFVDVQGFCYKRNEAQLWCAGDGLH